jgi:phosphoenolpyruvate synthase/pyruvate phosphate dikinase
MVSNFSQVVSMSILLTKDDSQETIEVEGGGKALNLHKMISKGAPIPEFIVVANSFFPEVY